MADNMWAHADRGKVVDTTVYTYILRRTYHRLAKLRNIDMHCSGNIHDRAMKAAAAAGFFGNSA